MDRVEILKQISQEAAACTKCTLHHSRKFSVPGEGPADARIMFIGEGPGFHENEQGRPFVGAAGKFLDELLAEIHLKRADVYITNVVKCRPPQNRDPQPDELAACSDYIDRQIEAINPRLIVTLGRFSMQRFLPNAKISEIHGQARLIHGRMVVAMYHPAAALHQGSLKPALIEDFKRLPGYIAKAEQALAEQAKTAHSGATTPEAAEPKPPEVKKDPKQLSLF
jgi:DNA polymerase